MKKIFKLLSLVLILSVTAVACGDKKECAEDCKKECCEKKDASSEQVDEASTEEATEIQGDEQAHVCTPSCEADPHSCPNHDHDHDH